MPHIDTWLDGRNLRVTPVPSGEGRLEGEALTYALTSYLRHQGRVPEEVVVILAEDYLRRAFPAGEDL